MLLVSFTTMYIVMFLNVDSWGHVMLSLTRSYMALLMTLPMALSMLFFMWPMYKNKGANYTIIAGAIAAFIICLSLLRSQTPISDVQYMKAMIPHHSSAIMVSQKATLLDPETQALAKGIIESQKREISEMQAIIARLEAKDR